MYHGGVSESGLRELLGLQQLRLEASFKNGGVRLFQNLVESFPEHQVCVLNTEHVLRSGVKQTVPVSCRHTESQQLTVVHGLQSFVLITVCARSGRELRVHANVKPKSGDFRAVGSNFTLPGLQITARS